MSLVVEERRSPLRSQIVLVVGFVLMVAAGIATVLVPELSSDEAEDAQTSETTDEAGVEPLADEPTPGD